MEFNRLAYRALLSWRERPSRKPLVLRGARQVGKSTLVKFFAKNYKQKILMNLEKTKDRNFFEELDDIQTIVDSIFLAYNVSKEKGDVLLFIDEIQESPKAIRQLRYLYEEHPEIHVIAAGSLLEFSMRFVQGIPVGRVEYLYLYPVNFTEFLGAIGHKAALKELQKMPPATHAEKSMRDLFHTYIITGGMPEVVATYAKDKGFSNLPRIYESIWSTYIEDVEKYAKNDSERRIIKHIIKTAPFTLDKRIKFQNFGNSNYRSREVGEAMRNLEDAGILKLIYPTTSLQPPVQSDFKKSPRIQFLDTGLLNHILGVQVEMLGLSDMNDAFRGAIVPHMVYQELIALNMHKKEKPNFWVREKSQSTSEVDLVIETSGVVVPIEIKSGSTGKLKSLHQFINRCNHSYAVRIYGGKFSVEELKTPEGKPYTLMNLPYYTATILPEMVKWFLKSYKKD